MTSERIIPRAVNYLSGVAIMLLAFAPLSQAADSAESYAPIQAKLPDSTLSGKVVYVDFWASWCVPCRQSFPWMEQMHKKYHDSGLEVVAVNLDRQPQAADKFLKDIPASFKIVYDSTGTLAKQYQLETMPTSLLYGRDGKLISRHIGFQSEDASELELEIKGLLGKKVSK